MCVLRAVLHSYPYVKTRLALWVNCKPALRKTCKCEQLSPFWKRCWGTRMRVFAKECNLFVHPNRLFVQTANSILVSKPWCGIYTRVQHELRTEMWKLLFCIPKACKIRNVWCNLGSNTTGINWTWKGDNQGLVVRTIQDEFCFRFFPPSPFFCSARCTLLNTLKTAFCEAKRSVTKQCDHVCNKPTNSLAECKNTRAVITNHLWTLASPFVIFCTPVPMHLPRSLLCLSGAHNLTWWLVLSLQLRWCTV